MCAGKQKGSGILPSPAGGANSQQACQRWPVRAAEGRPAAQTLTDAWSCAATGDQLGHLRLILLGGREAPGAALNGAGRGGRAGFPWVSQRERALRQKLAVVSEAPGAALGTGVGPGVISGSGTCAVVVMADMVVAVFDGSLTSPLPLLLLPRYSRQKLASK